MKSCFIRTQLQLKNHAFVLRGIQGDPKCEEIKENIEENHGIYIKNDFKIKTKYNHYTSL